MGLAVLLQWRSLELVGLRRNIAVEACASNYVAALSRLKLKWLILQA